MTKIFEEKQKAKREKEANKIAAMPTIAMCNWEMSGPATPGKFLYRSQVIKITKRSVVMRTLEGRGTVTLSSTPGWNVFDFVKIEQMPCDTRQWARADEEMKKFLETVKCT